MNVCADSNSIVPMQIQKVKKKYQKIQNSYTKNSDNYLRVLVTLVALAAAEELFREANVAAHGTYLLKIHHFFFFCFFFLVSKQKKEREKQMPKTTKTKALLSRCLRVISHLYRGTHSWFLILY